MRIGLDENAYNINILLVKGWKRRKVGKTGIS